MLAARIDLAQGSLGPGHVLSIFGRSNRPAIFDHLKGLVYSLWFAMFQNDRDTIAACTRERCNPALNSGSRALI
jgi:hypothetical protein